MKINTVQPFHDDKSSCYKISFARLIPLKDIYTAIKTTYEKDIPFGPDLHLLFFFVCPG